MYAGQIVEHAAVHTLYKRPRHPYAQGLIRSIPVVGEAHRRLTGIEGTAPSPLAWPPGCRFHPRCPHVMPVCPTVVPALLPLANSTANGTAGRTAGRIPGRAAPQPVHVACHLYPQSDGTRTSDGE